MKKRIYLILSLICVALFTQCATSKSQATGWNYNSSYEDRLTNLDPNSGWSGEGRNQRQKIEQKIIYSANLSLTVKQLDSANASISDIAKKYKGYVSESGTARAVIRVESKYLKQAITDIELLGRIEWKKVIGQDVTDQYFDLTIRLENAEKARKRYLELLAKAEHVEAALKVERELERLNGTIDNIKGKLSKMNHLTKYSTITINLNEKKKLGVLGYVGVGLYRSVKWLFIRG